MVAAFLLAGAVAGALLIPRLLAGGEAPSQVGLAPGGGGHGVVHAAPAPPLHVARPALGAPVLSGGALLLPVLQPALAPSHAKPKPLPKRVSVSPKPAQLPVDETPAEQPKQDSPPVTVPTQPAQPARPAQPAEPAPQPRVEANSRPHEPKPRAKGGIQPGPPAVPVTILPSAAAKVEQAIAETTTAATTTTTTSAPTSGSGGDAAPAPTEDAKQPLSSTTSVQLLPGP